MLSGRSFSQAQHYNDVHSISMADVKFWTTRTSPIP